MTKLFFQLPPIRDVLHGPDHPDRSPVRVAFEVGFSVHPTDFTHARDDAVFDVVGSTIVHGRETGGSNHRQIVWMHRTEARVRRARKLLDWDIEDSVRFGRPAQAA